MHEPTPPRPLDQIDRDLNIERGILAYERRAGRSTPGTCATWRHIDSLLEERLRAVQPLPHLPDASPR